MDGAISLLRAGGVLTIDDALGSGTAAGLLLETKELLAAGVLRGDTPQSEAFSKIIYELLPGMLDSYRLISWLHPTDAHPALGRAIRAMQFLCFAIGDAEAAPHALAAPRVWPAAGVSLDPHGALLSVNGFNGTRYAWHSDTVRPRRKLTSIYWPRFEPAWAPGAGGELRFVVNGSEVLVAPRADRLIVFSSEIPHEVLVSRSPRISLTVWGLGVGERAWAPTKTLETEHRCTSDLCRDRSRGRRRGS